MKINIAFNLFYAIKKNFKVVVSQKALLCRMYGLYFICCALLFRAFEEWFYIFEITSNLLCYSLNLSVIVSSARCYSIHWLHVCVTVTVACRYFYHPFQVVAL